MFFCRLVIIRIPIFPLLDSTIYDFLRYRMLKDIVTVRINVYLSILYKFYLFILNIYKIYIYIRFYKLTVNFVHTKLTENKYFKKCSIHIQKKGCFLKTKHPFKIFRLMFFKLYGCHHLGMIRLFLISYIITF